MPFFRKSATKFLVPARHSRHRTACLALYRALLRLAPQIPLPHDLATGWGEKVTNPIAQQISRAFRRNLGDTSPRIIYPALVAGYNMLSVLKIASTTPESEHYASIISFLRDRLAERYRSRAAWVPPPPKPQPRENAQPLLVKVTPEPTRFNPQPQPEYIAPRRPRLQSQLGGSGKRQIPKIEVANGDFPFLRFSKPSPTGEFARVIRQLVNKRIDRTRKILAMYEDIDDYELEDEWEVYVAEQLWREQNEKEGKNGKTAVLKTLNWVFADNTAQQKAANQPKHRIFAFQAEERRHTFYNTARPIDDSVREEESNWMDAHDVGCGTGRSGDERSYTYTFHHHGIEHIEGILTAQRQDSVARAHALQNLVKEEKALQAHEREVYKEQQRLAWEQRQEAERGPNWRDEVFKQNYWKAAEARYAQMKKPTHDENGHRLGAGLSTKEVNEIQDWEMKVVRRHGVEWMGKVQFKDVPVALGDMIADKWPVQRLEPPTERL
ncbi:hypothetical protein F5Y16DRAFT_385391 [Xylariaceae sp. FL0255]|nr:hypothetical protein F5Y16DRAFT_385391 [Xylariaceae sp. FL0255]